MRRINGILFFLIFFLTIFLISCTKENDSSFGKTTAVFNKNKTYGAMTDIDGNVYKTITIGTQTWMAENLLTTHYRNGDTIPKVTNSSTWANLNAGAYCNYENTNSYNNIATFGRLYNWYTIIDSRNIAPDGWHIPSKVEWLTLINYLGGYNVAGGKLKETDTFHWQSPNMGATNETGFTALPGGSCNSLGWYSGIDKSTSWWSTDRPASYGLTFDITYETDSIYEILFDKKSGFSIRCIMDK